MRRGPLFEKPWVICGQGRIEACRILGFTEIPAIIVDISKEDRMLRSLVENMARRYRHLSIVDGNNDFSFQISKIVAADPAPTSLPRENDAILEEFDRLLISDSRMPFIRGEPDNKDSTLRWDIVGYAQRNWLYVVVTKAGRKVRFAMVTDEPGGFSIGSQRFGIDAETSRSRAKWPTNFSRGLYVPTALCRNLVTQDRRNTP